MTEEERKKLFNKIKKKTRGYKEARLNIIQDNLSLVVNLAKKYYYPRMNIEFLDFIEEGNIGLVKAVEKFDPGKGFKFSTYASWWIEKHFQDAFLKSRSVVQIPEKIWRYMKKIEKTTTILLQQTGQAPEIGELARRIDMSIAELRETLQSAMKIKNIRSLDYYLDDDKTSTLEDIVPKEEGSADNVVDNLSSLEQVESLLSLLTEEERCVLEMRFGLVNDDKCTYKDIGEKYKLSPSKAKEIQERAIKKLRRIVLHNKL
ncbi:MAG: sigma-70 family RNA polymerase sigma factor [Elusimicrobiota bacterium]